MSTWTLPLVLLGIMTVAIQVFTISWVANLVRTDDTTLKLEGKATGMSSALSLAGFFVFALVPALFGRNNALRFIEYMPFHPVYTFVAGMLKVPSGRSDLSGIYTIIWTVLAFILPCLGYVLINSSITVALWDKVRLNRRLWSRPE